MSRHSALRAYEIDAGEMELNRIYALDGGRFAIALYDGHDVTVRVHAADGSAEYDLSYGGVDAEDAPTTAGELLDECLGGKG